jgi:hypothetical protein
MSRRKNKAGGRSVIVEVEMEDDEENCIEMARTTPRLNI